VGGVAFGPDGATLASGARDGVVALWRIADGTAVYQRAGHGLGITALAFSYLNTLASAGDRTVRTWDLHEGTWGVVISDTSYVTALAFSMDGNWLASANEEKTVRVWDARRATESGRMAGENTVALGADNQPMVATAVGNDIELRHLYVPSELVARLTGHTEPVTAVALKDGRRLASASWDSTVRLWSWEGGQPKLEHTLPTGSPAHAVAFSRKGDAVAAGLADGRVIVWRLTSDPPTEKRMLVGHTGKVASLDWSPDDAWLATGSHDQTVKVWRVADGAQLAVLGGHTRKVTAVAFDPSGTTLATGSDDGGIRLWCPEAAK
jgi:WD40 repeat protein